MQHFPRRVTLRYVSQLLGCHHLCVCDLRAVASLQVWPHLCTCYTATAVKGQLQLVPNSLSSHFVCAGDLTQTTTTTACSDGVLLPMSPGRALLLPTWQKVAQCTHTSLAPATPVIRFQRALHSDNATRHKHSFNHPAATSAAASAAVAVAPPSQAVADRHAPSGEALLLVQPRHRSSADQQEAQRLVETFTGEPAAPTYIYYFQRLSV